MLSWFILFVLNDCTLTKTRSPCLLLQYTCTCRHSELQQSCSHRHCTVSLWRFADTSVPAGFSPSQGWVSVSCESEQSDQIFCFLSHNEPLLSYSLFGPASNLWPTNWQSYICLVLSWKVPVTLTPPPPPPPPPLRCSTLGHVQTRSRRSDLVTARCDNRLPVGSGMLRAADWLLAIHMSGLLLWHLLVYFDDIHFSQREHLSSCPRCDWQNTEMTLF